MFCQILHFPVSDSKMEMKEPDVKFLVFLTITISLFGGQIFNYKQLALDTKIGDPAKTGRCCEIHQDW